MNKQCRSYGTPPPPLPPHAFLFKVHLLNRSNSWCKHRTYSRCCTAGKSHICAYAQIFLLVQLKFSANLLTAQGEEHRDTVEKQCRLTILLQVLTLQTGKRIFLYQTWSCPCYEWQNVWVHERPAPQAWNKDGEIAREDGIVCLI